MITVAAIKGMGPLLASVLAIMGIVAIVVTVTGAAPESAPAQSIETPVPLGYHYEVSLFDQVGAPVLYVADGSIDYIIHSGFPSVSFIEAGSGEEITLLPGGFAVEFRLVPD